MIAALSDRGPDGNGHLTIENVLFVHTRLAILDLTPNAAQPFKSSCGRWVVTFNGEIYNYRDLASELPRSRSKGRDSRSDTEVLTEYIAEFGLLRALERSDGMFAIAAHDLHERQVLLARDRFGEKPLYYGQFKEGLWFGSDLRARTALGGNDLEINRDAVASLLEWGYISSRESIYVGYRQVEPGHFVSIDSTSPLDVPSATCYWDAETSCQLAAPASASDTMSVVEQAVSSRLISDVPVGLFLSGGVDSSIVALAASRLGADVTAFTVKPIGDSRMDESELAVSTAQRLGHRSEVLEVDPSDALELIPTLSQRIAEPFADSSLIPTMLISRAASHRVKVVLTGDGGDELFGGYTRHLEVSRMFDHPMLRRASARRLASSVLSLLPSSSIDRISGVPPFNRWPLLSVRLPKVARLMAASSARDGFVDVQRTWNKNPALGEAATLGLPSGEYSDLTWMRIVDATNYLPGDILTKVDRAAMSFGLETRAPFLDPRLWSHALALPEDDLIRGNVQKAVLRDLLQSAGLGDVSGAPKRGFGIPLDRWLRTDLRSWAEGLLSAQGAHSRSLFDPDQVQRLWEAHIAGKVDASQVLWGPLMLESWLQPQVQA